MLSLMYGDFMKTRMEKYHSGDNLEQRVDKNTHLYDEIYSIKREITSNVTVLDNANEIDIDKIKNMVNPNRETYRRTRQYNELLGKENIYNKRTEKFNFDEPEPENYDINEILKRKKKLREDYDLGKVRKISDTQYDILKGLNLKNIEEDLDCKQKEELKNLIDTLSSNAEDKTIDFFGELKDDSKVEEEKIVDIEKKEIKDKKENSFYSSSFSFAKDDFEELEDLKKEVKKHNSTMKVLIWVIVCILIASIAFIVYNYVDFDLLLK